MCRFLKIPDWIMGFFSPTGCVVWTVYKNHHPATIDAHTKTTTPTPSTFPHFSENIVPAFHSKAMLLPPTKTNQRHIASL
jgi:hypothetical protein